MNMEQISFQQAAEKLMQWYNIEDTPNFSYKKYQAKLEAREDSYKKKIKLESIASFIENYKENAEMLRRIFLMYTTLNLQDQSTFLKSLMVMPKQSADEFAANLDDDVRVIIKEDIEITKTLRPANFESFRNFDGRSVLSGMLDSCEGRWKDEVGRYVFPILLPGSIPVGFSGRSLTPNIVKYLTRFEYGFEKTDILYGLNVAIPAILEKGYVILVEGILDALRCRSLGFNNVVAPMSTYASEEQIILLKALTDKFILAFDNDQGGNSATELTSKNLDKYRLLYERILLPQDQDPDSFGLTNPLDLQILLASKWK